MRREWCYDFAYRGGEKRSLSWNGATIFAVVLNGYRSCVEGHDVGRLVLSQPNAGRKLASLWHGRKATTIRWHTRPRLGSDGSAIRLFRIPGPGPGEVRETRDRRVGTSKCSTSGKSAGILPSQSGFAHLRSDNERPAEMTMLAVATATAAGIGFTILALTLRRRARHLLSVGYDPALDNMRRVLTRRASGTSQRHA